MEGEAIARETCILLEPCPILEAMQRKSFGDMPCPIARSLERVGEWWSILILRDAFYGLTRFDEFQKAWRSRPTSSPGV